MKKIVFTLLIVLFIVCISNYGCKKADLEKYTLIVEKAEGIDGFPEAGTYTYDQNSMVFYNYDTFGAYTDPSLLLDNEVVELNGAITMDRDHILQVSCDKVDFSGTWLGSFTWHEHMGGVCTQMEGVVSENISIEHSGDTILVTIPSEGLELTGSIYGDGYFSVLFEKKIPKDLMYEYTAIGQFKSPTDLTGKFKITRYLMSGVARESVTCFATADFSGTKN